MSIGTFLIVYRVYYQERRFFRSRRTGQTSPTGSQTPNKAKSLFYLLFTLNLLYFILVSPVVFTTSILFRDEKAEVSYPRFKAIIYLMQYCNHSLNFIFYGKRSAEFSLHWVNNAMFFFFSLILVGITSPPYRQTLYTWLESLSPYLPHGCQRMIRQRSKKLSQPGSKRTAGSAGPNSNPNKPKQLRLNLENNQVKSTTETTAAIPVNDDTNHQAPKESVVLLSA